MSLLSKTLEKFGVKEFSQLTEEEKVTYREWQEILTGKKLTDEDVAEFLQFELSAVQGKLINPNLSQREDVFLKMKMEMITNIQKFLNAPEVMKRQLETTLTNQ